MIILLILLLAPAAFPAPIADDPLIAAQEMAREVLARNAQERRVPKAEGERRLLLAGRAQFASLWTRDFCYAALGALEAGESSVVRDSLEALLAYERDDGLVPRRLAAESNRRQLIRSALRLPSRKRAFRVPEYRTWGGGEALDDNALVVWVADEYLKKTGDRAFLERHRDELLAAVVWLEARERDGLLVQAPEADWLDVTYRGGAVAYSNVLYVQALRSIADLTGDPAYAERADRTARRVVDAFWDESLGRLKDTTSDARFAADGNLLAVWLGLLDARRSASVLDAAERELALPNGLYSCVRPAYPRGMYPKYLRLFGMEGYGSNSFIYPWTTSLFALAAASQGRVAQARAALDALSAAALRDGTFTECLERDGRKPVRRRFYRSESDFTWSAGFFLKAAEAVRRAGASEPGAAASH